MGWSAARKGRQRSDSASGCDAMLSFRDPGTCLYVIQGSFFDDFGKASMWSVGFAISTIGLGFFSVAGALQSLRWRNRGINCFAWLHSFAVSSILMVVTLYL